MKKSSLLVLLFALVIRIIYLLDYSDSPTFFLPIADSYNYDDLARQLIETGRLSKAHFQQSLFYPLFLAASYFFTGNSILIARVLQVCIGALTCALVCRLGQKMFDRKTGLAAGLIISLNGPLLFYEAELLAEGWACFWSVALILVLDRCLKSRSLRSCLAFGIVAALSTLTRPNFLPFFAASGLWLLYRLRAGGLDRKILASRAGVLLGGFLLVVAPVALASFHVTGHIGFLPHSGGINLYIGNNPELMHEVGIRRGYEWKNLMSLPFKEGVSDPRRADSFFYEEAEQAVIRAPLVFLKGIASKSWQFIQSREIPNDVDLYLFRVWSWLLSALVWKAGGFGFPFGFLLPLALLGLIYRWRQAPVPILLFLLVYLLSIILVFVCARFRVPVIPLLSILSAAGLLELVARIKARDFRHVAAMVASMAIWIALMAASGPIKEETFDFRSELYNYLGINHLYRGKKDYNKAEKAFLEALQINVDYPEPRYHLACIYEERGEFERAADQYRRTIQLAPDYADAHYNLGRILASQRKPDQASDHFREVIRIKPDYAKAHNNLGNVLLVLGRADEAISSYAAAVRIDPNLAETHFNLGVTLYRAGRIREAEVHLSEALRLSPGDEEALRLLRLIKRNEASRGSFFHP